MRKIDEIINDTIENINEEEKKTIQYYFEKKYEELEKDGFADTYYCHMDKQNTGKTFEVLQRIIPFEKPLTDNTYIDSNDLKLLPAWLIKFEDGLIRCVFAEEIIPSEIEQQKICDKIIKKIEEGLSYHLIVDIKEFGNHKNLCLTITPTEDESNEIIVKKNEKVLEEFETEKENLEMELHRIYWM